MKRILIGALVGTVIYFGFQATMWMGGFHRDFQTYSPAQDSVMQALQTHLGKEGLYMMPSVDPNQPNARELEEKHMTEGIGKPWAMVFYHEHFEGMNPMNMVKGILYNLVCCLMAAAVIFYGRFGRFAQRFGVCMAFALFAILQGAFTQMNWWDYPWNFVKTQVIDLGIGWLLCSFWMGWYLRPKAA